MHTKRHKKPLNINYLEHNLFTQLSAHIIMFVFIFTLIEEYYQAIRKGVLRACTKTKFIVYYCYFIFSNSFRLDEKRLQTMN